MIKYNNEGRIEKIVKFSEVVKLYDNNETHWTIEVSKGVKPDDIGILMYSYPNLYFIKLEK